MMPTQPDATDLMHGGISGCKTYLCPGDAVPLVQVGEECSGTSTAVPTGWLFGQGSLAWPARSWWQLRTKYQDRRPEAVS